MDLVSGWNAILYSFSPVFTEPTFQVFQRLATGWLLCTGRRTVCGMIPFADPTRERAHDAYHRFFAGASWAVEQLWYHVFTLVVRLIPPEGKLVFLMDDTLFHKSGKRVDGVGWWRDAVRSVGSRVVHALGLNIVVVCLRVDPPWGGEPLALPVFALLHRKRQENLLELGSAILITLRAWLRERPFDIVADGFFSTLAGKLPPGVTLTSRMRRDAAIYELPPDRRPGQRGAPRKRGARLPTPQNIAKRAKSWRRMEINERGKKRTRSVHVRTVLWYKVAGTAPVLLVISRDPDGVEKDDFFFSTDPKAMPEHVLEKYSNRWPIEDTFRWVKQVLGVQQPQSWAPGAPERAAAFGLALYSLNWYWYLTEAVDRVKPRKRSWYQRKPHPSFLDAIAALRRQIWQNRILRRIDVGRRERQLLDALIYAAEVA